jgi:hypothetical protein
MYNIDLCIVHLFAAWAGFLCGVLSGAVVGWFFHQEGWLGGYGSYSRRLIRLGHISFFGIGFLNALFAFTASVVHTPDLIAHIASIGLIIGAITMPLCCFATAWQKQLRFLFPVPGASLLVGVAITLSMFVRS